MSFKLTLASCTSAITQFVPNREARVYDSGVGPASCLGSPPVRQPRRCLEERIVWGAKAKPSAQPISRPAALLHDQKRKVWADKSSPPASATGARSSAHRFAFALAIFPPIGGLISVVPLTVLSLPAQCPLHVATAASVSAARRAAARCAWANVDRDWLAVFSPERVSSPRSAAKSRGWSWRTQSKSMERIT